MKQPVVPTIEERSEPGEAPPGGGIDEEMANVTELEIAQAVVGTLQTRQFAQLEAAVHPVKGLRLTPYSYVNLETDVLIPADEVAEWAASEEIIVWGSYDGTGDPMELTFREYYERFIYDMDYAAADQISVNERLGMGNTLDNAAEVYPEAMIVEFHFEGTEINEGMDWRSLRVVLEEYEGGWYLVALIHDEWTI